MNNSLYEKCILLMKDLAIFANELLTASKENNENSNQLKPFPKQGTDLDKFNWALEQQRLTQTKSNIDNEISKQSEKTKIIPFKTKDNNTKKSETAIVKQGDNTMALLNVKGLLLYDKQRKDGRYHGKWRVDGQYTSFYARTFKELETKALAIITGKTKITKQEKLTFKKWAEQWLESFHKKNVSENVYKNDCGIFRNHIYPHIGNKALNKLTGYEVQETINKCPFSRQRQIVTDKLTACLYKAYQIDLLNKDITKAVEKPSHECEEGTALTTAEEKILINKLKSKDMENYILFLLFTGVRRNEGLGIEWRHLDFTNNNIYIEQQVTTKNKITKKLKTKKSKRVIKMFPIIKKTFLPLSVDKDPNERIFNFYPDVISKAFAKFCKEELEKEFCIKDLRTTFATRCEKMGISAKVVQAWLGHSKLNTTVNTYQITDNELIEMEFGKITDNFDPLFDPLFNEFD